MANHAYLRVWTRDFSLQTMLAEFARFLTTAPLSATQNAFDELIVQAVDSVFYIFWQIGNGLDMFGAAVSADGRFIEFADGITEVFGSFRARHNYSPP